jgi:RNA-directed DNA polymerase
VRYADDCVVLCPTESRLQEALEWVHQHLTSLGLMLSAEKTKRTKFREGFAISSWSVTMRPKSMEQFKTKIRELTPRHHHLDQEVIPKRNRVIRGPANYFATPYSDVGNLFRRLDRWLRMRLRCMKFKRKSRAANGRFRLRSFRNRGLLSLRARRPAPAYAMGLLPHAGAITMGSPGARNGHAGKSRELTLARQRGRRGMTLSLTHLCRMGWAAVNNGTAAE